MESTFGELDVASRYGQWLTQLYPRTRAGWYYKTSTKQQHWLHLQKSQNVQLENEQKTRWGDSKFALKMLLKHEKIRLLQILLWSWAGGPSPRYSRPSKTNIRLRHSLTSFTVGSNFGIWDSMKSLFEALLCETPNAFIEEIASAYATHMSVPVVLRSKLGSTGPTRTIWRPPLDPSQNAD